MIRAVYHSDPDVDHGIASDHARFTGLFHALFRRTNIFFRNNTADYFINKFEA